MSRVHFFLKNKCSSFNTGFDIVDSGLVMEVFVNFKCKLSAIWKTNLKKTNTHVNVLTLAGVRQVFPALNLGVLCYLLTFNNFYIFRSISWNKHSKILYLLSSLSALSNNHMMKMFRDLKMSHFKILNVKHRQHKSHVTRSREIIALNFWKLFKKTD